MAIRKFTALSPAKINLSLNITGREEDTGYHLLSLVNQQIELYDEIFLELGGSKSSNISVIPDGIEFTRENFFQLHDITKNVAARAVSRSLKVLRLQENFSLTIKKRIPLQAGLGGGSSNAGSILKIFQAFYGLFDGDAQYIALSIGSDVPFFLKTAVSQVTGVGEEVSPLDVSPIVETPFVLVGVPKIGVSTKDAYGWYRQSGIPFSPLPEKFSLKNDLEKSVLQKVPEVKRLKEKMSELSPLTLMSGSGSAVFSLFKSEEELKKAEKTLKTLASNTWATKILAESLQPVEL